MLAVELVRRGAARHGARTAVVAGAESMTFAEVDGAANRLAHVLTGLGVGPGARVGLLVDNGLWSVPIDFACLKAGVARVPLNPRLSLDEQARMIEGTGVQLLVHTAALAERASELVARLDGLQPACLGPTEAVDAPDLITEMSAASARDPLLPARPDDPVVVAYTSGTSGALKAVVHTQASWAAIAANVLVNLVSPGPDSVMLHAASLIHASGTFVLPYWIRGGVSAVLPGFDPATYLDAVATHRATEINLVPTMLGMLVASGAAERGDVSRLRTAFYGASPMPGPLLEQVLDLWGPRFVQYYGQTEAPLAITVLDKGDHADPGLWGSCGHPSVDAEVRVADENGAPLGVAAVGELQLRAPFAMAGYYAAPDLTAETITTDGWVRTRDLARVDERGYLTLVDRTSDMIITGGYNVYPREVEEALLTHPAVAAAAVVGAPDETWVEAVTAFVTLRPGVQPPVAEELRGAVRARLAGYKVPKEVHVVDALPLSPVGKVLRRALRDPLWGRS
jgi:acyl-CoA synthetase (AMP-forming)/AMP-acid ligase II